MTCKNCNSAIEEYNNYCTQCGAKVIKNRLTIKNLIAHIGETFFNYDNTLLRTIIDLIIMPEIVIDSYVKGVRKKYVNPVSFFGIALTLAGFLLFIMSKFYKQYLDFSSFYENIGLYDDPASKQLMDGSANFTLEYSQLIFTVMIPAFALISWIVFFDKKYNLTEHIVVSLYGMSLFSITSSILTLSILIIIPEWYLLYGLTIYFVLFFYYCFLFKRLFQLSLSQLILKTIFFVFVFILLFIIFEIVLIAFMFINGDMQQIIETKKQLNG